LIDNIPLRILLSFFYSSQGNFAFLEALSSSKVHLTSYEACSTYLEAWHGSLAFYKRHQCGMPFIMTYGMQTPSPREKHILLSEMLSSRRNIMVYLCLKELI
jgi:hypothetical protein